MRVATKSEKSTLRNMGRVILNILFILLRASLKFRRSLGLTTCSSFLTAQKISNGAYALVSFCSRIFETHTELFEYMN